MQTREYTCDACCKFTVRAPAASIAAMAARFVNLAEKRKESNFNIADKRKWKRKKRKRKKEKIVHVSSKTSKKESSDSPNRAIDISVHFCVSGGKVSFCFYLKSVSHCSRSSKSPTLRVNFPPLRSATVWMIQKRGDMETHIFIKTSERAHA